MIEKLNLTALNILTEEFAPRRDLRLTEYSADWRMRERLWEKRKTILPLL